MDEPWQLCRRPRGKGATVTYTDSTVAKGSTYYYRVVANNLVGYTKAYAAPAAGYPYVSADSLSNSNRAFQRSSSR